MSKSRQHHAPRAICIVRLSALGDVLMLVPLIRTLQHHFPHASITWVISRPAYDLVAGMTGVEFIVIDKPQSILDYWRFKQKMRHRCFDVLLATQSSFRANLLYPLIKAHLKIGFDALRAKDGHQWFIDETILPGQDHTADGFLKFATHLGAVPPCIRWDLPIDAQAVNWAKNHLPQGEGPILLVNPAASKPERTWVLERYIAVIAYAQKQWNARVILTGGPGPYDRSLGDAIAAEVEVTNLIGQTKPMQLLALIQAADVLLCPDTGPSHMAAAVNTPVVALHAVTSSQVSGPYTFRHYCVDYYPQAVCEILKKTPATNVWGTHAHGPLTMRLIPVDAVIQQLTKVLMSNRPND